RSLPSWSCGFDSRHPLSGFRAGQSAFSVFEWGLLNGFLAVACHTRATTALSPSVLLAGRLVKELGSGLGVHQVGPDLLFRSDCSFGHGVVGHPCVELAARDEAEDRGGPLAGNRSDDADCDIRGVPLVGEDLDIEGRAVKNRGVFSPVQE